MDKIIQESDFNIRNILSSIFRQKVIIIIISPVILIGVFVILLLRTPVYEATVKMHIAGKTQVASDIYYDIGVRGIHRTQMAIVTSIPVIKRAVITLNLHKRPLDYEKKFSHPLKKYLIDYKVKKVSKELSSLTPEQLREYFINRSIEILKGSITTELISGTDLFLIRVLDYDPDKAIEVANVVSRSYIIFDLQQQLAELTQKYGMRHPSVQQLRNNIFQMTEKLSGKQLPDLEAIGTASVKVIEQARSTRNPIGIPKIQILLLAFFVSIFAGLGIAVIYDFYLNKTFKSPNDIVKYTGLPLLGSIPKRKYKDDVLINFDKIKYSKSELLYLDFFDDLADQLFIYMKVDRQKTILLTSAFPNAGNTTICINLGICLSQKMDTQTLLIDANFRNAKMHKLFNIPIDPGLANILEESKLIEYHANTKDDNKISMSHDIPEEERTKTKTSKKLKDKSYLNSQTIDIIHNINPRLDILLAGKASITPTRLLNNPKLFAIFEILKRDYDAIIIDCTNLREFKDAGMLSSHVDGVVLVVNDGKERYQIVTNSLSYIRQKKGNPMGIILNRRKFPIPEIIYKRI